MDFSQPLDDRIPDGMFPRRAFSRSMTTRSGSLRRNRLYRNGEAISNTTCNLPGEDHSRTPSTRTAAACAENDRNTKKMVAIKLLVLKSIPIHPLFQGKNLFLLIKLRQFIIAHSLLSAGAGQGQNGAQCADVGNFQHLLWHVAKFDPDIPFSGLAQPADQQGESCTIGPWHPGQIHAHHPIPVDGFKDLLASFQQARDAGEIQLATHLPAPIRRLVDICSAQWADALRLCSASRAMSASSPDLRISSAKELR